MKIFYYTMGKIVITFGKPTEYENFTVSIHKISIVVSLIIRIVNIRFRFKRVTFSLLFAFEVFDYLFYQILQVKPTLIRVNVLCFTLGRIEIVEIPNARLQQKGFSQYVFKMCVSIYAFIS